MMTEITERRRRQALRTIITEIFMLIVIIILVVVLALVAMGYRINFEKGFEHSGLVQINSIPTGAAITVDGEGIFLPTNQSRTMVSGPHTITLTKDGFTSWSKTITVTEGLMYRLSYPRLYKEDRTPTAISLALEGETDAPVPEQAFVSLDHKTLLLTFADSSTWRYLNLNDDTPRIRSFSVDGIIATDSKLEIISWADNNNRLLVKATSAEQTEWLILNLNKPAESINLTKEFGLDFTTIRIESGDKLLALSAGQLREINLSSREISKILVSGVESFVNLESAIAYVGDISANSRSNVTATDAATEATSTELTASTDVAATARAIFIYTIGDDAPTFALPLADGATSHLALSAYYGDSYLAYTSGQQFFVYYGKLPGSRDDFADQMELSASTTLDFAPTQLTVRGDGELIVADAGPALAVFDAESYQITTFTTESTPTWLTEYDFYTTRDGWLTAHDFDNSNPRALVAGISTTLPATISENDRFLYYFDSTATLQRESIR